MTKPWIVAYHADCNDGWCAAWVAKRALGDNAHLVPVQYGIPAAEQIPLNGVPNLIFVDWCPKPSDMERLCQRFDVIGIVDHHQKNVEDFLSFWGAEDCPLKGFREKVAISFDPSKSGARMAWEHWFPHTKPPLLVQYVEDRDLWRHQLPHTKEVTAWLSCYEHGMDIWDMLAHKINDPDRKDMPNAHMVAVGECVLKNQDRRIIRHLKGNTFLVHTVYGTKETTFWPLGPIPCVNCTDVEIISELGHRLAQGHPYSATWRLDGSRIVYSLRSSETGANVAEIAKQFGGGGHPHAAGFTV